MKTNTKPLISWDDFAKIDLRVGTVVHAEAFNEAKKPAYKVWVDFGECGILKSSAQITDLYNPTELIGKQVIGVLNFPAKQIATIKSTFLLLGAIGTAGEVTLLTTDKNVKNGNAIG